MVFTNDLTIDADHHAPHAHAADEMATLLEKGTNSNTKSSSRVSRFGYTGFMIVFVTLSSSAFVFLLNRGSNFPTNGGNIEVQVAKAQHPSTEEPDALDVLSSTPMLTSSFKAHDDELYFTYDAFSKGGEGLGGSPIFIAQYDEYVQILNTDLGNLIIKKAKEVNALILIVTPGASVKEATKVIEKKQGCVQKENDPHYCLLFIFEGKINSEGKPLLVVSTVDENDTPHPIVTVDPAEPNGILAGYSAILSKKYESDAIRRAYLQLSDGPLKQPEVMKTSQDVEDYCPKYPHIPSKPCPPPGTDAYVLTMEEGDHTTKIGKFHTRLFNGKLPGGTIKMKAGNTLRIQFLNKLLHQEGANKCLDINGKVTNTACEPDHTNIHLHGFWGSGEKPSDDIEMRIAPIGNPENDPTYYSYESYFRPNHMPGTHWIHPHSHGSSAIQVSGGAAMALIVEDRPGEEYGHQRFPIPKEVEHAKDVILVVQEFNIPTTTDIINKTFKQDKSTDKVFKFEPNTKYKPDGIELFKDFRLVNGQYQPTLNIIPGEWLRLRVIYAGWGGATPASLNLKISNIDGKVCETNLLAKDGIYLWDYPRALETFHIPAAGRADIMVRCKAAGKYTVTHFKNDPLFTLESKGLLVDSEEPTREFVDGDDGFFGEKFQEKYFPDYLQHIYEEVGVGCSCKTSLGFKGGPSINGVQYEPHKAVHTIKRGDVVERELIGISSHPYHQHVFPFKVTKGFAKDEWTPDVNGDGDIKDATQGGYFKNGDWHDNIRCGNQDTITIKYHPREILSKMMLHCHILTHEDVGMMSQEKIVDHHPCQCDALVMSDKQLLHYENKISKEVSENPLT